MRSGRCCSERAASDAVGRGQSRRPARATRRQPAGSRTAPGAASRRRSVPDAMRRILDESAARSCAAFIGSLAGGRSAARNSTTDADQTPAVARSDDRNSPSTSPAHRPCIRGKSQRHARDRPQRRALRSAARVAGGSAAERGPARRRATSSFPPGSLLNPPVRRGPGALSRGRRRQRGSQPARGGHAAQGAGPRGLQPGHDEQLHLRRRTLRLLRNDLRRLRRRPPDTTAPAPSTRT